MTIAERTEEIQRFASDLLLEELDWVTFYRKTLGLRGIVRQRFPNKDALDEFEQTQAYLEIQRKVSELRKKGPLPDDPEEPTKVITVRLPKSLHEALGVEAHEHHTSMNKLCISKLLQFIDNEMIPNEPET